MVSKADKAKSALIEQVAKRIKASQKGARAAQAELFARLVYAHVPPDDMLEVPAEELAARTTCLLDFANVRKSGTPKVRALKRPRQESEGWSSEHSVIEIVNDDMPFLVDSVTAALEPYEGRVFLVVHPIVEVTRNRAGRLQKIFLSGKGPDTALRESMMQVLISEQPSDVLPEIVETIKEVLHDVRVSVEDWRKMRQRCRELITELEINPPNLDQHEVSQGVEFLKWLDDDHFTFLGFREYRYRGSGASATAQIDKGSGLGVLRNPESSVFAGLRSLGKLPPMSASSSVSRSCCGSRSPTKGPRCIGRSTWTRSRSRPSTSRAG